MFQAIILDLVQVRQITIVEVQRDNEGAPRPSHSSNVLCKYGQQIQPLQFQIVEGKCEMQSFKHLGRDQFTKAAEKGVDYIQGAYIGMPTDEENIARVIYTRSGEQV